MLAQGLDAVSIVVPTKMHRKVAIVKVYRPVHMSLLRNRADTVENAEAIIGAAEKNNKLVMVGHIERFNPAVIKLKKRLLRKALLGKIVSISTEVGHTIQE
ncbi:MAG: hypothetical protein R2741_15535 [Methanolobus sp.]